MAVRIDGCLVVNSYASPDNMADHIPQLMVWLETFEWAGPQIFSGDWNEEFQDSWIEALAEAQGLVPSRVLSDSTRWLGTKCIDYFLHSGI